MLIPLLTPQSAPSDATTSHASDMYVMIFFRIDEDDFSYKVLGIKTDCNIGPNFPSIRTTFYVDASKLFPLY